MAESLTRLFAPRAVAIVGASTDPAKPSSRAARFMTSRGFAGPIYGVNPSGEPNPLMTAMVRTVDDLPEGVDVAVLAIPASGVKEAVAACGRKKIPFAIAFANGFADIGKSKEQLELAADAAAAGVRLVGPNCLGVLDLKSQFAGTFGRLIQQGKLAHGPVSLVTQSGAVGQAILLSFQDLGIGLSSWIATGNEADITALEGIDFMLGRDDNSMVVAVLETVSNAGSRLKALSRKSRETRKPILVLKGGKSDAGRRAAQSHTGRIVGNQESWRQLIAKSALLEVDNLEHLTDVSLAMGVLGWRRVGPVAILCGSGGMGGLLCDDLSAQNIALAALPSATRKSLQAILPSGSSTANPVDPTTVSEDVYYQAAETLVRSQGVETLLLVVNSLARDYPTMGVRLEHLVGVAASLGKRVGITYFSPYDVLPAETEKRLIAKGLLVLATSPRLARALGVIHAWDAQAGSRSGSAEAGIDTAAESTPPAGSASPPPALSLLDLRPLLSKYGIATVETQAVTTRQEAAQARRGPGGRLVLKLEGTAIAHKSDAGFVKVGLRSSEDVEHAFAELLHLQQDAGGVIVAQPQIENAVEIIIGGLGDPELGQLVTVGLGGIFVELIGKMRVAPCPVSIEESAELISSGEIARMLAGYRGAPAKDRRALAEIIRGFSQLLADHPEIKEFELNPVMVDAEGRGAFVVDALAVKRQGG